MTANLSWNGIQLYCNVSDASNNQVDSNIITVTVNPLPLAVTTQPANKTIQLGESLTLSLKATGSELQYQWYYKKKGQTSFSVWKNHTNTSETCTPNVTWNGIQLYCKVTDGTGKSVNSDTVTVIVKSVPVITTQPTNQKITLGDPVTLSLKATGSALTYQRYFKKKGQTSFSVWKNRTHASETCTPNDTWDGIQLYCKVTDDDGDTVDSDTVTVTVTVPVTITRQPTSQTINLGDTITVSLKATGSGLKYQWYFKKSGQSTFSVWNGRTHASETVTPNATWNGIQLYCEVTDHDGNTVKSNIVTIHLK